MSSYTEYDARRSFLHVEFDFMRNKELHPYESYCVYTTVSFRQCLLSNVHFEGFHFTSSV